MKLFRPLFIKLCFLFFLFGLGGCQSIDIRGQHVSDKAIAEINSRKISKAELVRLIGSPTYAPKYSSNIWYYIQRSASRRAWFDPKVIEQRIVKITFNKDKVQKAVLLTNMHNEDIAIQSNYTKTGGTDQSGLQKFVKNIGRFNKTTDGSKRVKKKRK